MPLWGRREDVSKTAIDCSGNNFRWGTAHVPGLGTVTESVTGPDLVADLATVPNRLLLLIWQHKVLSTRMIKARD